MAWPPYDGQALFCIVKLKILYGSQMEPDGFLDVFPGFVFCLALGNAAWQRWYCGHVKAIFVFFD